MIILSLDTCCGRCSVAIYKDGNCIKYLIEDTPNRQAELAIPMIEQAINSCGLTYNEVDYFVCTKGPGSFTGIRIGIATIQGINQTLKKKTLGISTLECMSYHTDNKQVMTCLSAGRGQYYCQNFSNNISMSDIKLLDEGSAIQLASGTKIIGAIADKELPDAKLLAMAAYRRIVENNLNDAELKPLYVRESDAVEKRRDQA